MASLILTEGTSRLRNVPFSEDVLQMLSLLADLGAEVVCYRQEQMVEIDTKSIMRFVISAEVAKKMRASILVMGPLLARFGKVSIGFPGGDAIGARPIDYHLNNFKKMGASIETNVDCVSAQATCLKAGTYALDYPSVGATENIMMAAVLTQGTTRIINAALEPEVLDLIKALQKMGAQINIFPTAVIEIQGVDHLNPIEHAVMYDRLEAGTLLLAAAATGGSIHLPEAPASSLELFLMKLEEMGHSITLGAQGVGVVFKATLNPRAISFKTTPYPGFPTDLQAPMMAALCCADGVSVIEETVFENRLLHATQLQKMGVSIVINGSKATIKGVSSLKGASVVAHDIRASSALVIAGLAATGTTIVSGVHHWRRGYEDLDKKLISLGARIACKTEQEFSAQESFIIGGHYNNEIQI
nr:UDP-N-acetylglucosamine enolpyruvyl transferase [uncultured bacterium]